MYHQSSSDRPENKDTLYIVHKANITEYLDLPNSSRVMENRKFPLQLMADKGEHVVKTIVSRI